MRNFDKNIYELQTLGFSIVEDVMPQQNISALKSHLSRALSSDAAKYGGRPQKHNGLVDNLVVHGRPFLELLDNAVMHDVYSHFLGESCILYSYTSTILPPNDRVPASDIHVDSPRVIPNYWSGMIMTLALDDFTPENGASWYLPGSHVLETRPSDDTFYRYSVQVNRKAGDALFFHPRVFHKAGENKTSATRYALGTYAVRAFMKPRFDFARMVPLEELDWASDRLKRFLGFHTRIPVEMDEYYVPGEKRLYKANQG